MGDRGRFYLAMGLHTSLAAGTYLLGKVATNNFPVMVLGLFRFAVAALAFGLLVRSRGYDLAAPFREARGGFLFAGFLGVLLNQVGFLWGLKLTLPSHAALLYALTPTVVLMLAWTRGQERPSLRKTLGIALAFSGVVVVFYGRHGGGLPPHWLVGDLLVLVAVFAWAGYTVVSRPLVLRFGAERSTAISIFAGSAMFMPLGLWGLRGFHRGGIPLLGWIAVLYLGLIASVVMYLLWFHALRLREPSRVAIAANGQPILTALLAWAFLGQPITAQFGVGAALVITGVVLTQWG
jgi:drug/metabolite transporter (DMT)-like permease